jgi:hypothetical protein
VAPVLGEYKYFGRVRLMHGVLHPHLPAEDPPTEHREDAEAATDEYNGRYHHGPHHPPIEEVPPCRGDLPMGGLQGGLL